MIKKILPAALALGALIGSTGVAHAGGTNNLAVVIPMYAYNVDTRQQGGLGDVGEFTYEPQVDETVTSSREWEGASPFAMGLRISSGSSDGVGDGDVAVDFRLAEDTGRTLYRLIDARSSVSCPVRGDEGQSTPPVTVEVDGVRSTVEESLVREVAVGGSTATFALERITSRDQFAPAIPVGGGENHRAGGWRLDVTVNAAHHRYYVAATHCSSYRGPLDPGPTG